MSVGQSMGETCRSVGPDLTELQNRINLAMATSSSLYASGEEMLRVLSPLKEYFSVILERLKEECRNADVLISGPAQPLGKIIHEITGIPFVSIQFSNFGGGGGTGIRHAGEVLVNSLRKKLGLPSITNPLTVGANSDQLSLYAMSPQVFSKPAHWPKHVHITGFFFDIADHWPRSEELISFVSGPNRPIAITFGSMVHEDESALVKLIRSVVERSGLRAVVQGIGDRQGPDSSVPIYWCSYVPHSWLFKNVSCIVHHGGGGTTGAAFRSGVPSVFVPHGVSFDQHYWSQFACDAGYALPPIPFSNLTAPALVQTINETLGNSALREASKRLGVKIRAENGVGNARKLIEDLVSKVGWT
jgi:UDP:flavonoid glycosyltransferase YjiC (YdhE family)